MANNGLVTDMDGNLVSGDITDPDSLAAASRLATNKDKQTALSNQLYQANALRQLGAGGLQKGRMAGDVYLPDTAGTALATLNAIQGVTDSMHGKQDMADLIGQRQSDLDRFVKNWARAQKPTQNESQGIGVSIPNIDNPSVDSSPGLGLDGNSALAALLSQR